ncbi:MAG: sugar phosphate nucleotidyltransferase [Burkholderiaceae bacterium]|nr:sugar phosphate nucleotidyltransferase [Burkholderiaceae bacterium]
MNDVVGVIAAAGRATRLAPLPCSKELMPIGVHREPAELRGRPKVVSQYLLEKMRAAGAERIFFVVRSGKFDIADYYGDGSRLGLSIAYLMMNEPWGPPFSAAQAAAFVGDAIVLFGFPDILIQPEDCFVRARDRLRETGADVVLGLFRGAPTDALDLVRTDARGRVVELVTKEEAPPRGEADTGYMVAAWGPGFTRFLVAETQRLSALARSAARGPAPDWPMGAVFAAAIRAGLHVDSLFLPDARFLDIGTPEGLAAAGGFPGVWAGCGERE